MSGVAMQRSKLISPPWTAVTRSSAPTMSAPASRASSAFAPRAKTATRSVRPVRLDPARRYEVTDPFSGRPGQVVSGQELLDRGLDLTLQPESALARHLAPLAG